MIRLSVEEVPDKYVAYVISKYGVKKEDLELEVRRHVSHIVGRYKKIICKFQNFYFHQKF